MDFDAFRQSLAADAPAAGLSLSLRSLWHAQRGDWDTAHRLVQDDDGADAAWVHAHLHRVEGDLANAGYWYRRAGRPAATGPLEAEWEAIGRALIEKT
ncbi:MAG: hypothetical protein H6907_01460 [Hyphomicrobiales bacterium]|nr:hypothetical protein [Hyphomicrobiales bacterium]MCP5370372.1 hypothetical protein [Hyphomicrobiales bacterium]